MTTIAVLMMAAASVASAAQGGGYVPCPQGLFRCGEMKESNSGRKGTPARCDGGEVNALWNKAVKWDKKVVGVQRRERKVAHMIFELSEQYREFPQKHDYLRRTAAAVNDGLLVGFLDPLANDLRSGKQCFWNERFVVSGCRYIPMSCFDETGIQARLLKLCDFTKELLDDLASNADALASGLPTGFYDLPNDGTTVPKLCTSGTPPCQEHMRSALGQIIREQGKALKSCR